MRITHRHGRKGAQRKAVINRKSGTSELRGGSGFHFGGVRPRPRSIPDSLKRQSRNQSGSYRPQKSRKCENGFIEITWSIVQYVSANKCLPLRPLTRCFSKMGRERYGMRPYFCKGGIHLTQVSPMRGLFCRTPGTRPTSACLAFIV